jgi:hypothetical protein
MHFLNPFLPPLRLPSCSPHLFSYVDARYLIDKALSKALLHRKPVLIEVCR